MQFLACDRYKGSSSEENSLLPRSRPSFKDYFHVRPSAFRWWKDTRFNQVNATTRPTPTLVSHLPPVRINLHVYTSDTYEHVHTWDNFYVQYTLWKRCHRIPTWNFELPLVFYESMFFADWFQEKCPANFRVTFSTHGKRCKAIPSRFSCQGKHTTFLRVVRISTNIIRRKGWRVARPERLSRRVIRISAKSLTRTRWQPDNKSLIVTHVLYDKDVVICGGSSFLISTKYCPYFAKYLFLSNVMYIIYMSDWNVVHQIIIISDVDVVR